MTEVHSMNTHKRRTVAAMWGMVAALTFILARQVQANCADVYCAAFGFTCTGTRYNLGTTRPCCCTVGTSSCCQYTCQDAYCVVGSVYGTYSVGGGVKHTPSDCNVSNGTCVDR